jgi:hypothetical protein
MLNPFNTIKKWILFEILDIEAVLEAIKKVDALSSQLLKKQKERDDAVR